MSTTNNKSNKPFLFPRANSTLLPDPSKFFSPNLLSTPLPTNSFFQNFVLKNGDQPEYIHPHLIKSSNSSISVSYPTRSSNSNAISQVFKPDLTITSSKKDSQKGSNGKHVISSYSDLSVTLDIPSTNMTFFLVRGSPYVTLSVTKPTPLSISTIHDIIYFSSNESFTKFTIRFNNNQAWILYSSIKIKLTHSRSEITSEAFSGTIRIALLPDSDSKHESVLDRCSFCYPVSGGAVLKEPFCVEYKWEKKGWGDLLMLAHPLHLQLLSENDMNNVTVLNDFKYKSIDGELVGIIGDSWILKTEPVNITWYSTQGVKEKYHEEIVSSLFKDVEGLNSSSIKTTTCHAFGKLIARAARLALIAEEVFFYDVIPKVKVKKFLKETIEPWLEGTFKGNQFLHDEKWGGIVQSSAENSLAIYNNHHCTLGYFVYAIAVLVKIDPAWGRKYKSQAYSILEDYMNSSVKSNSNYTRLRNFDLYNLHSWAGGVTEFPDGRHQMGSSEAVNAYYAAALFGMAYGDAQVVSIGSTLAALEICAAKMWWHIEKDGKLYEKDFIKENRIMGILWSNKRSSELWFAPSEWKEARLGIQVLPLLPISETLFSDVEYVKELVEWTLPALKRKDIGEKMKGFVFALQGIFDNEVALKNIKSLKGFEDGNSMTNLLWWLHSRG
ncbi:glucan endo-1,3-beta-D-glucosidase ARB_01444-like [Vicia villosa]|uniref:glucan endo-1,3-beta-D-glucosidase ARB_01444-like n=1 Tax=Vicia villosa TaxID=3911 RepID=UPI00273A938A|nr:glucan endo-1,3-beta-D-glucosidase ARB_01444-like [Vicia villosa]